MFALLAERYRDAAVRARGGEPSAAASRPTTIRRIAAEIGHVAFERPITIAQPWTDTRGVRHAGFLGRPVAMHAMRGISAHSNGFQTCRALHLLQLLIGSVDVPGGWRYKAPYPRPCPPGPRPSGRPGEIVPGKPLPGSPLGFPRGPEDLLLEADGRPVRIDKAFSWDAPLAVHGMLQTVIANAWRGDPYPVEVLFLYMANMAWNSAMNPGETMRMLADKDPATGAYRIPRFIYVDAYRSETVAYADLVLPDTTYLERWDCISLLDRPIGTAHGPGDAIRQPVVAAGPRRAPVPGGADRPGRAPQAAGLRPPRRRAALSRRLPRLSGPPPAQARHRPAGRLARRPRATSRAAARRTTASSRPTSPTAASGSSTWRPRRATSSRSTAPISPARASSACSTPRHRSRSTSTPRRCSASGSRRRATAPCSRRTATASASAPTSTRCRSGISRSSRRRSPTTDYPAARDHPAADADVPQLGLAERLAAPDPDPQLPLHEPAHRRRARASPTATGSRSPARTAGPGPSCG